MLHSLSLQWDYLPEREHCLFLFFFFFCSSGLNVHYLNTCRVVDNIGMFLLFLSCVFVKASLFLGQFLCLGGGGSIMSRLRCLKVLPYRCVKKKKKNSEQIIRIYAGFLSIYRSSGRILSFMIVTSHNLEVIQVPSVCSIVCLITSLEPCCPTKKQQIWIEKRKFQLQCYSDKVP